MSTWIWLQCGKVSGKDTDIIIIVVPPKTYARLYTTDFSNQRRQKHMETLGCDLVAESQMAIEPVDNIGIYIYSKCISLLLEYVFKHVFCEWWNHVLFIKVGLHLHIVSHVGSSLVLVHIFALPPSLTNLAGRFMKPWTLRDQLNNWQNTRDVNTKTW